MKGALRDETIALVALQTKKPGGLGWPQILAEVLIEGSAIRMWEAYQPSLFPDTGPHSAWAKASAEVAAWENEGYHYVSILDPGYPDQLRSVREAPAILFYAGNLRRVDAGMSIVGSRSASDQGRKIARAAAGLLVDCGLSVISGLAGGIDAAAHEAALQGGGRTVAVVGTGIDRYYPAGNRALQETIMREGLVISQFRPGTGPSKQTFPMRNAVMSGYGIATIIVEATEHSGTRIQARKAIDHGRPVILTNTVVERTTWGKELVGRPDVHVVADLAQLREVIGRIRDRRSEIEKTLGRLLSAPVA